MVKNVVVAIVLFFAGSRLFAGAAVDPSLKAFVQSETNSTARVLVIMEREADFMPKIRRYDTSRVIAYQREMVKRSLKRTENALRSEGVNLNTVKLRKVFWLSNSFSADVTQAGLKTLAQLPGIRKIYRNAGVAMDRPVRKSPASRRFRDDLVATPYNYAEIGLDKVIEEFPQLTGRGILLGHIDTGVDGSHPAIKGKIVKFYDSRLKKVAEPIDEDEHGTHTAGTMVGGDRNSIKIGVAPEAKLLSAGYLVDDEQMLGSLEWMLDPDGNPATFDLPRAINNSWGLKEGWADPELYYTAVANLEAVGVLPVFAAGNEGSRPKTLRFPGNHPNVLTIGATGPDHKIAEFSSRGPGEFRGKATEKPNITAPGVDIESSIPGGKLEKMDGTSMATPQVTGALALIYQVQPNLNPGQMMELLMRTSVPVNEAGEPIAKKRWNPIYGVGKFNVYNALRALKTHERMGPMALMRDSNNWDSAPTFAFVGGRSGGEFAFLDEKAPYMTKEDFQWIQ